MQEHREVPGTFRSLEVVGISIIQARERSKIILLT